MQLIDIDKNPRLTDFRKTPGEHVFAGHCNGIVGKNHLTTERKQQGNIILAERIKDEFESGKLKVVWINHNSGNLNEFSIKMVRPEVIELFLQLYDKFYEHKSFFVVCDDSLQISKSKETEYKKFYPIDTCEQLENHFHMWYLD